MTTTPAASNGLCSSAKKYRADTSSSGGGGGGQHAISTAGGKYNDDSLLIKDKEKIELKNIKMNATAANSGAVSTAAFTNLNSDYQIKINLVDNNPAAAVVGGAANGGGGGGSTARRCFCACSRAQCSKESARRTRKRIKRPLPCLFAWSLLIATSGAYFILVSPRLLENVLGGDLHAWTAVVSLQIVVLCYVIMNFLIAIFRDPGRFQKIVIPPDDPTFNDDNKCPLYRSITIKKASVKTKWCSTCNFYRPPRCSHCSICDACIDQFDHHCPWLNNCVGKRNYRFFFQFLGFLVLHMVIVFGACLAVVLKEKQLSTVPAIASFVIMGIIALLILPIGGLFSFHIVLISNGRTTNEHVTGKYRGQNFFSRGFVVNFIYLFCGSLSPQLKPVKVDRERLKRRAASKQDAAGIAEPASDGGKKASVQLSLTGSGGGEVKSAAAGRLHNRASGAGVAVGADESQHLKASYSQQGSPGKEEPTRLQEQDLLELVLKNKREKALKNQSRSTSSSSPADSYRSNSALDEPATAAVAATAASRS